MKGNHNQGFTLMEMLIVVTIIGILASIVMPRFLTTAASAEKSAHRAERQTLNAQLELFFFTNGTQAVDGALTGWTTDVQLYFPEGIPQACNQETAWVASNGRIVLHADHE